MKLLVFTAAALVVSATPRATFPPLDAWKQAVLSGNQSTLSSFYSTDPRRSLLLGKQPEALDQETGFWAALKAQGLVELNPQILSMSQANGATQLVMRISG